MARRMTKAQMNDRIRRAMGVLCTLIQTEGVNRLPPEKQSWLREQVERFRKFTPENDPWGEHDFGSIIDPEDRRPILLEDRRLGPGLPRARCTTALPPDHHASRGVLGRGGTSTAGSHRSGCGDLR